MACAWVPFISLLPRTGLSLTCEVSSHSIGTLSPLNSKVPRTVDSLSGGNDNPIMSGVERTNQYGVVPAEIKKCLTGLEFLTRIVDGTLPAPPIQRVLDFRLIKVDRGSTTFAGIPRSDFYNPLDSVHGGYTAALLDSCMSCAVHSTLEVGYSYATLEVKINYVRAIVAETGEVRAEGKIVSSGRRIATAEGRLVDSGGKIYAHGTTTCLIFAL
jgi:uncharacterized protein (TIGR00369 family)